ncbi:MAG TPA: hypothetical protein VJ954_03950, partial [Ignavibacteriaceae bacterium]|nr:hypothetical protein [Ignavibacteriaceae bacterium]
MKKIFFFVIFLSLVNNAFAQDSEIEGKVDSLLSKMTLQEKIGQLVRKASLNKNTAGLIREGKIGEMGYCSPSV